MRISFISCLLLATICFASCKRIELQRPTSVVYLEILTDPEPALPENESIDVNSSQDLYARAYGPEIDLYRICLYDTETHEFAGEDFLPAEGGFLNVVPGFYDMIIYSAGSPVTILENEQMRSKIYAYTNAVESNDGLMIPEPEHMFVAVMQNVGIPIYSETDTIRTMQVKTTRIAETYSIEFANVVGLDRVDKAEIRVSGQVPGKFLWDQRTPDLAGSVHFEPIIDIDGGRIYALFNTFGRNQYRYNRMVVTLVITDCNGRNHQWKVDVTDIVDNPDNLGNQIQIINELTIPDTDDGGGLNPDVNDWDDQITVVPIS